MKKYTAPEFEVETLLSADMILASGENVEMDASNMYGLFDDEK